MNRKIRTKPASAEELQIAKSIVPELRKTELLATGVFFSLCLLAFVQLLRVDDFFRTAFCFMVCFCCAIPAAYAGFLLYIAQRTANQIESGNVEVIYGKTQKIIQENRHFLAKGTLSDGTSVTFWVSFELIKSKSGYAIIRTDAGDVRLADRISYFSAYADDDADDE